MSRGNKILLTTEPHGRMEWVIVSGTPKPGTCMELKPATDLGAGNLHTYEPAGTSAASGSRGMSADGDRIPVAVLLEDELRGKLMTEAYTSGEIGKVYFPIPGEQLNVLKLDVAGTGDDFTIGDKLMIDDGTGKVLLSSGSIESEPFLSLETITDPTADQLVWAQFTGQ